MGLSTSFECFNGGYGKFHNFRKAVAKAAGIPLEVMAGFYDEKEWLCWATNSFAREALERRLEAFPVPWESFAHDPICILLNHSDCEGSISWQDAEKLAKRLEELAPEIPLPEEMGIRSDWNFREGALQFAEGCREAVRQQKDIEFH